MPEQNQGKRLNQWAPPVFGIINFYSHGKIRKIQRIDFKKSGSQMRGQTDRWRDNTFHKIFTLHTGPIKQKTKRKSRTQGVIWVS